jgi:transcription factor C subunit 6
MPSLSWFLGYEIQGGCSERRRVSKCDAQKANTMARAQFASLLQIPGILGIKEVDCSSPVRSTCSSRELDQRLGHKWIMDSSNRTSGRRRQPSKKYTIDPFEGLDIVDSNPEDASRPPLETHDDDEDDDFQMDPNASPEPLDDDDLSAAEEDDDNDDDQTQHEFEDADGDSIIGDSEIGAPTVSRGFKRVKVDEIAKMKGDPRFNPRGLLEPAARGSKELQRLFFFGPARDDQMPALQAHFKWGAELTLPSRDVNAGGFGGFRASYYYKDKAVESELRLGWEWYDEKGGKESFRARQQTDDLVQQDSLLYLSPAASASCSLLMGPYKQQTRLEIGLHKSVDLNDVWTPKAPSADVPALVQDPKSHRNGWMINLGEKIQHVDWAPNLKGSRQFLAATTSPLIGPTQEEREFNVPYAPAFTPSPPAKSSIQIWEFCATSRGRINTKGAPVLRKVICTEWGNIKVFKWCPMPRKVSTEQSSGRTSLGLLAGIWADGTLRVLDVLLEATAGEKTTYELIKTAAFTAQPPNTICTCLTWISTTSIAAGCANGCIGIWDIPLSLKTEQRSDAEPTVFFSISSTYLLNVTTCYPSRPNVIISSSMSGHIQMTDLMEMTSKATMTSAATIKASRSRVGKSMLVWHEFSQVILTADDNFTLVAYPIRRFFRQISFTRYKSPVASLACSPVHPFVMAGCVGGEAISNNPLRRAYENKVPIWNQTWFTHEWRQISDEDITMADAPNLDKVMVDAYTDTDELANVKEKADSHPKEISRVLEGFKGKQIKLFNTEDAFTHRENGAVYSTVYEMKSSIDAMSWNPNLHVGGWIAAGMANGLLRVEDIAS